MMFDNNLIGNELFLLFIELLKMFDTFLLADFMLIYKGFNSLHLFIQPKRHLVDSIPMFVINGMIKR